MATDESKQYGRALTLLVADNQGGAVDLSNLRIKFVVKRSDTMTPNIADIRVFNVESSLALFLRDNLSPTVGLNSQSRGRVILQAGYESNFGVIFQGNIKQIIVGRESATDTFIDIVAGDGDRAYNFAIVNSTLAAGATQENQIAAAITPMSEKGVTAGPSGALSPDKLPRGKVMYGAARNYIRNVADTANMAFSIQDEKVTLIPKKSFLPGEVVVLTSKTGMIGTPQQTNEGVNVKCLLNPRIQIGGRIKIDNASVERLKINLSVAGAPENIPAPISADGTYYVLVTEHQGDTRGVEWYTSLICLYNDPSANPLNSTQVGYGE